MMRHRLLPVSCGQLPAAPHLWKSASGTRRRMREAAMDADMAAASVYQGDKG